MELSLSALQNELQTASESFPVMRNTSQRCSEMEAPDSIPQALFAPKGRNLPRKVKTPPQVDTLREYGSRQHVQVLCLKAETYPHKVKTSPQAETLRDGGSRFAGFTPKVKTSATTFRHSHRAQG